MENHLSSNTWSNPKKIAFRYVFIFFALFLLIYNNGIIPYSYIVLRYPNQLLEIIIPWIGKHILHLSQEITDFTNGSGDTTYDYVVIFTLATTALLGTIIWSVLDRKKNNYVKLYYWLTVAVRFYIGLLLIQYGLLKIIKLQYTFFIFLPKKIPT